MNKLFYPKLAIRNMKNNQKFYVPYIITCIITVAMYYIISSIAGNSALDTMRGAESLKMILEVGTGVVAIFSVIFLFYTNSFLMKRRKKELGLYNMLGMEKRHIAKVLFWETVYLAMIALVAGMAAGVLLYKGVLLLLYKILCFSVIFGFDFSVQAIKSSILLFGLIFILILASNLFQIWRTKPIELLKGGNVGEKEPKAKWFIALLGVVCVGIGYYIAITTKSPLEAISMFFVAVLLVMAGTYFLFSAGSIWVLKLMKKNKNYYYQTKHFTSVSGLMYRMKQNAVGLANICILSTMVLIMVSTTVSLYAGSDEELTTMYPYDFNAIICSKKGDFNQEEIWEKLNKALEKNGRTITRKSGYKSFNVALKEEKNGFVASNDFMIFDTDAVGWFQFMTKEEYETLANEALEDMKENEIYFYGSADKTFSKISIMEKEYQVKGELEYFADQNNQIELFYNMYYIIVKDQAELESLYQKQKDVYKDQASTFDYEIGFDTDGTEEEKIACANTVKEQLKKYVTKQTGSNKNALSDEMSLSFESRQEGEDAYFQINGGFLFLGILLGFLFIMATTLIIYYKQISEGYEDKEKFVIMEKVGMTKEEVRGSICSQVLKVFFLPIVVAGIHVIAAFPMIERLLAMFGLANRNLFIGCMFATIFVFFVFYGMVYGLTAKVYYKIVS